ncbi:MAG: glucoamylase family protein, partial [Abditibacteriaceae bacterium]
QEVLEAIHHFEKMDFRDADAYGYETTINQSYFSSPGKYWASNRHIGINQGPVILMIENHLTGLIWELMRDCEPLVRGLQRAGFTGGWLKNKET